jgi:glycine cleavage system H protein
MKLDPAAKYLPSHEWARPEGNLFVLGISDHAQESLGDVVYVDLPSVGSTFRKGEVFGVIESVKAASDLFCPVGGEIVAVNETLAKNPEAVNQDPYGAGWLVKVKAEGSADWNVLLSSDDYGKTAV